jgi:hypothetical protein
MIIIVALLGWGLVLMMGSIAGTLVPGVLDPTED